MRNSFVTFVHAYPLIPTLTMMPDLFLSSGEKKTWNYLTTLYQSLLDQAQSTGCECKRAKLLCRDGEYTFSPSLFKLKFIVLQPIIFKYLPCIGLKLCKVVILTWTNGFHAVLSLTHTLSAVYIMHMYRLVKHII